MHITIVDMQPPRGMQVSRTFEATDLIDDDIPDFLYDLRAHLFFTEVRKLLLYSRFDASLLPWDDQRLNQLEQQIGLVDLQACFPHQWNMPRPLSITCFFGAIDKAILLGLPEIRFYVDRYPFGVTVNIAKAAYITEKRAVQAMAPYRLHLALVSHQAVQALRMHSQRLPWVRTK